MICAFCSHETKIEATQVVGRQDSCQHCHRDLRICLNCVYYDKNSHWECRESVSEHVLDKEKANFCDQFKANSKNKDVVGQENTGISPREALLKAAESLFKKSS